MAIGNWLEQGHDQSYFQTLCMMRLYTPGHYPRSREGGESRPDEWNPLYWIVVVLNLKGLGRLCQAANVPELEDPTRSINILSC